jgi:CIC family chloride channel protein
VTIRSLLRRLYPPISVSGVGRRLIFGFMVGVVAGLGAIVFNLACAAVSQVLLDGVAGYRPEQPSGEHEFFGPTSTTIRVWLLPVCAALGGLLSGLVVYLLAPEAAGHGTDAAIDAYHNRRGRISHEVPLVKLVASALTIGSGGSGGREGPIAQIGAGFGSLLADLFKLPARERRILLASGIGAGVGSIFHAPLAGALFAAEILYSDAVFETDALIPAAVATIVAYCVFSLHSGFEPLFTTPAFAFHSPWELVPYTVLADRRASRVTKSIRYCERKLFGKWCESHYLIN